MTTPSLLQHLFWNWTLKNHAPTNALKNPQTILKSLVSFENHALMPCKIYIFILLHVPIVKIVLYSLQGSDNLQIWSVWKMLARGHEDSHSAEELQVWKSQHHDYRKMFVLRSLSTIRVYVPRLLHSISFNHLNNMLSSHN